MNLRRIFFTSPLILLGLCSAPAHADIAHSLAASSFTAGSSFARTQTLPDPYSGLLFLTGVAVIAGALELRRRISMR
jgi:hypothetical protein